MSDIVEPARGIEWDPINIERGLEKADLERVMAWEPQRRVELFAYAGLSWMVPADAWEEFVQGYESERGIQIDRPFPPVGLQYSPRQAKAIGRLLKIPPNTLTQRYNRVGVDLFIQLRFVQDNLRRDD